MGRVRAIAGTDDEFDIARAGGRPRLLYSDGDSAGFGILTFSALCDALPARRRRALDTEVVAGLARQPRLERRS